MASIEASVDLLLRIVKQDRELIKDLRDDLEALARADGMYELEAPCRRHHRTRPASRPRRSWFVGLPD